MVTREDVQMLQVSMHDALPVDVLESFCNLPEQELGMVFRQVFHLKGLQVHAKISTLRKFCDLDCLILEFELFDEANDILVTLTHLECLSL